MLKGGNIRVLLRMAVVLALVWGVPAGAVIIASGDGTGNTSAPSDDPGWDNVGKRHIWTGVYMGNGWVLTADHVGAGDITFSGTTRRAVPDSGEPLLTGGTYPADLLLFRIDSDPGVPAPVIASSPPSRLDEVVMIGQGRNRGDPIYDWDQDPDLDGWYWGPGRAMRWGTNEVKARSRTMDDGSRRTVYFSTDLSEPPATDHEAQAAGGDSGGAVFAVGSGGWELAGIMVTITNHLSQPEETLLYGNETWSAQLADYRGQILSIMADSYPCDDGKDDDGDELIDYPDDPGCDDWDDPFETSDALPCDDGFDNDGDELIDYPDDPGCGAPTWSTETPRCQDGIDNDGDGMIDYDGGLSVLGNAATEPDPECVGEPSRNSESTSSYPCGLGAELALLLPPLLWMRRRQR